MQSFGGSSNLPRQIMDCYLYILQNSLGKHYTGITKLEPKTRLAKHNRGGVQATKFGRPWELIRVERYHDYQTARNRERQIKGWHGGNAMKKLLRRAAGSSSGRTSAFGAEYPGSNPGPAALRESNLAW